MNGPDNPQLISYILADVAGIVAGLTGGANGGAKWRGLVAGLGAGLRTCHVNGQDRHPSTQLTAYINTADDSLPTAHSNACTFSFCCGHFSLPYSMLLLAALLNIPLVVGDVLCAQLAA